MTEHHQVTSRSGVVYDVSVSFPGGYPEPGVEYPVVYVTDPTFLFPLTHAVIGPRRGRPIVVGVTRPVETMDDYVRARQLDFTPFPSESTEERWSRRGIEVETGGGDDFFRLLAEDVRAWVEERYTVSEDRTLVGYSLGGMFAAYVLLTAPEAFDRYLIVSPWLVHDDGFIAGVERTRAGDSNDLPALVYLAVGTDETFPDVPDARMLSRASALAEALVSRRYPGLELEFDVLQGATHQSVLPLAISRGLAFLFERE